MVELFTAIRLVSGYPSPDVLPQIQRVSVVENAAQNLRRPLLRRKGVLPPEWGVYVDEALDIENNTFRSLDPSATNWVHHLQKTTGKFDAVPNFCNRRNAQELEAYGNQNRLPCRPGRITSRAGDGLVRKGKDGDAEQ